MNARENTCRAIEFRTPHWLPVDCPELGMNDVFYAALNLNASRNLEQREYFDSWGCRWVRTEVANMGQIATHPLQEWSSSDKFRWPDPCEPAIFDGMEKQIECHGDDYVYTGIAMLLFERMHSLRGFENTLIDLATGDERIETLADRIVEYDIELINSLSSRFPGAFAGFTSTDDWGTELSSFISPKLWNEFFMPRYKKIYDALHGAGMHAWQHSCGRVNELIPGFIEAGVDVLNLQQPLALGIEEMGRRFAGKVCFSTICDIQKTLPHKGEEAIRQEARSLLDHWATPEGGLILTDYGDFSAFGAAGWKKEAMVKAFMEFDPWKKRQCAAQSTPA